MCTKRKELDNFKENVAFSKDGGAGETERSVAWDKKGVDDGVCICAQCGGGPELSGTIPTPKRKRTEKQNQSEKNKCQRLWKRC